jgi:hypothetical protein
VTEIKLEAEKEYPSKKLPENFTWNVVKRQQWIQKSMSDCQESAWFLNSESEKMVWLIIDMLIINYVALAGILSCFKAYEQALRI